jgi:hypothetical protein
LSRMSPAISAAVTIDKILDALGHRRTATC